MTDVAEQNGAMRMLLDLEATGACTPVALDLTGANLTWERYVGLLALLGAIKRQTSWYIGDALNQGEQLFGEDVAQAAETLGFNPHTLVNYRWVCSRIPPVRRVAGLSFGAHDAVASLGPREQRKWLKAALDNSWNRERLRGALRDADAVPKQPRLALGEAQERATERLVGARERLLAAAERRDDGWWVPADVWDAFVDAA